MKKIYLFPITLLLCYFVTLSKIHAQSTTLSVSPPVVEILLAPNKKLTQTFTLQTAGENLEVTPELHLATPSDEEGHMTIDPSPLTRQSLSDGGLPLTITSSPPLNSPFSIQNSLFTLTLTLEAAAADTTQDLYLALVFKTSPTGSPLTRQNLAVGGGISALILITLDPTDAIPIDLSLTNFSPPTLHDSWTPLTISPTLKNTTAIMIRPQGLYEVISPTGQTIFSLPLYPTLVLGNSTRRILGSANPQELQLPGLQVQSPSNPGSSIPLSLTWSPAWHNLGPHRLRLTIHSEGGNNLTSSEKLIWILPLRLTLICLVVLVLLASLILIKRKSLPPIDSTLLKYQQLS